MCIFLSCLITALAAAPSFAQPHIVKRPVQFAKSKSGATIKGSLTGNQTVDCTLRAELPLPPAVARAVVETGDDTLFVPWLLASLPPLKARLEATSRSAAAEADQLHFADMAAQVARLRKIGMP
ncbi:MAG: hypothetical protein MUF08_16015 [Burkholderiaceae bacterium]|jgi:hypothetical protein|nr:hypothetical protein [Burkholderiaceae bacterium]MCU0966508.1 hypothetical protein [Burkholderiaceae bacterium]